MIGLTSLILMLGAVAGHAAPARFVFQSVNTPGMADALRRLAIRHDDNEVLRASAERYRDLRWVVMRDAEGQGQLTWRDPRVQPAHAFYLGRAAAVTEFDRYLPAETPGWLGLDHPLVENGLGFVVDTDERGRLLSMVAEHLIEVEYARLGRPTSAIIKEMRAVGRPPAALGTNAGDLWASAELRRYLEYVRRTSLARFDAANFVLEYRHELGLSVAQFRELVPHANKDLLAASEAVDKLCNVAGGLAQSKFLDVRAQTRARAFHLEATMIAAQIAGELKNLWSVACEVHLGDRASSF